MPSLVVKHEGGMCSSINVRGHKVIADVPQEMGGEDRGPTPVDLLAGSLGTCIAFYIARWCREAQIACDGFEVKVDYVHRPGEPLRPSPGGRGVNARHLPGGEKTGAIESGEGVHRPQHALPHS